MMKNILIILGFFIFFNHASFAIDAAALKQKIESISGLTIYLKEEYVKKMLSDQTMLYYPEILEEAVSNTLKAPTPNLATFKKKLAKVLHNKVPAHTIAKRISDLSLNTVSYKTFLRAFGDMSLNEVNTLTYGSSLTHPSPESLLGQYLKETGAKITIRTFASAPPINNRNAPQGPTKILVPVSRNSFEIFKKYFSNHNFMLHYGHALVSQKGKVYSYVDSGRNWNIPEINTVLAAALLTSTEAQRLEQFFNLFHPPYWSMYAHTDKSFIGMYPWGLTGYSATGGYTYNCTAWIGYLPIGDKLVDSYTFPPNYEDHPNAEPISKKLTQYESNDPLVKRIWTVPGHQFFSEVIGQKEANLRGEFAGPGWLMSTLIGSTSNKRVPIVFVVVLDVGQQIPEEYQLNFEMPQ